MGYISKEAVYKEIIDNDHKIYDSLYNDGTVADDVVAVVLDLIDRVPVIQDTEFIPVELLKRTIKKIAIVLGAFILGFYCLMWIVAEGFAM